VHTVSTSAAALPETVTPADIEDLKSTLRGTLLAAGEAGYDEARAVWNGMIDRRPALVVRALGVADVMAAVNFARDRHLPLAIKGGGHNISGLAVCDGGLVIDMSRNRGVWVDPVARTTHAQAGCLLGDVDRETQLHGLAAVLGFVSNTGIAGLTLGGGFGYLSRRYGWTCDNVRSMEVVTADGRLVRASARENEDLFWGLRGGGGNFGVVTDIEYELYPVGPEIVGGAIAWPIEFADEVIELYTSLTRNAPPELACVFGMRLAPPAPWLAKEIHGKPIVALFVCHTGTVADGERLVAPVKALGRPVGDIIQRRSYVSQQSLLDATQPAGRRYYWKSEYLPAVEATLLERFKAHTQTITSLHSALLAFPLDGALNRLPEDHSPAGNRRTGAVLNVTAAWDDPNDDARNIEWARTAWGDLRRFSTGGTYVNFLTEEEGDDRIHAAYGANYARLVDVKTTWDPLNLFCVNKNISPRTD
jgi:FAD/FMN-containing dehydrogenase